MINLEKEIREQPSVLSSLLEKNKETLNLIVKELEEKNINNIYFAARGTSDHACVYAQYLFGIVMGIPCTLGTPSIFTQYGTEIKFNNTLVIGVSQSGRAEDVNCVLESAKKQGAPTLAITNYEDSLLATTAKYHLFCNAGEEKSIAATKTFTSQMYLLALLCAEWSKNQELKNALELIPSQLDSALDYLPSQIESIVPSLLDYESAVVLGRGISYPIALEGALKILETNKMKVKGYPISDFYHGPVAQLHDNDLAFVLGQSGLMLDDAKKMIAKLDNVGAKTIVITDEPEICGKNTLITVKNTGCEYTMAFIFALAMQMFALKLVIEKGIDPDKSNVIAKITITK